MIVLIVRIYMWSAFSDTMAGCIEVQIDGVRAQVSG